MNIYEDLTGKIFERLTVIERAEDYITPQGRKIIQWLCECNCGNIIVVNSTSLRRGATKSCGCYRKETASNTGKSRFIDLSGCIYYNLKVISLDHVSKDSESYWICKCICGNNCIVSRASLRNGDTKSCGCLKESWIALKLKEYFSENYNAISEYKIFRNPETNRWLPYDIYIPSKKIFVEIHGDQHYYFDKRWHKNRKTFNGSIKRDLVKKKFAKKNGVFIEIDLRKIKTSEEAIDYIESLLQN